MYGHWSKCSCMLDTCFYFNSKWFLSCLDYILCLVVLLVSEDGLALLIGTNRVGLGRRQASPQNTVSNKNRVMDIAQKTYYYINMSLRNLNYDSCLHER
jgi:hypothetical protein